MDIEPQRRAVENAHLNRKIIKTVMILCVIMVAVLGLFIHKMLSPRMLDVDQLRANGVVVFDQPRIVESFSLVNKLSEAVDNDIFIGKWTLVFFGFTHCPDVCPTTLADLNRVYQGLPDEARQQLQIMLVSVDPERDNPQLLKNYVEYFNKDYLGLTGDFVTIRKLASNFNVAFKRVNLPQGYTVDHSSHILMVNPRGQYQGFIKQPFSVGVINTSLLSVMAQF